jgi:Zn-dependent M32 family carboxypeptidase
MTYEPVGSAKKRDESDSMKSYEELMDQYDPGASTAELDRDFGELEAFLPALAEGDFSPWSGWLKENVHSHGSLYPSPVMMERATGSLPDVKIFKRHLEARYLAG